MVSPVSGGSNDYKHRNRITSFMDNLDPGYSTTHNLRGYSAVKEGRSASDVVADIRRSRGNDSQYNNPNSRAGANPLARGNGYAKGENSVPDGGFDYGDAGIKTEEDEEAIRDAAAKSRNQMLTQEDFLRLLTAQLEAQDPTKPADNNELVTQMSQLSMVESLNSINDSMSNVMSTMAESSALNATSLIGTYVYTDSDKAFYDGGNAGVSWAIDAGDESYSDVKLTIKDATTGEVVYTDTSDFVSGEIKFFWPGAYSPDGPIDMPDNGEGGVDKPGDGGDGGDTGEGGDGGTPGSGEGDKTKRAAREGESQPWEEIKPAPPQVDNTLPGDLPQDPDLENGIDVDGDGNPDYPRCPAGKYVLEVTGVNTKGQTVNLKVKSLALVTAVTLGKTMDDTMLTLYGHGQISFAKAKQITL